MSDRQQQPISAERLAEMREAVLRYGPSNCWTGTTGTLAMQMRQLLEERLRLMSVIEQMAREATDNG